MVLNANGDLARFASYGLPIATDVVGGYVGPLAGVLTGLEWARANAPGCAYVASFACDAPFVPRDLVSRLLAALEKEAADLACASSGGRDHPVFALWPVVSRRSAPGSRKRGHPQGGCLDWALSSRPRGVRHRAGRSVLQRQRARRDESGGGPSRRGRPMSEAKAGRPSFRILLGWPPRWGRARRASSMRSTRPARSPRRRQMGIRTGAPGCW